MLLLFGLYIFKHIITCILKYNRYFDTYNMVVKNKSFLKCVLIKHPRENLVVFIFVYLDFAHCIITTAE